MCYSCATNPSIHHHCRCIVAMSLLLSHHGVAFAVALLWFHCRCHGVAFIVALSRFCHHCRGVTFVSVIVSSLPSWCRLHRHIHQKKKFHLIPTYSFLTPKIRGISKE